MRTRADDAAHPSIRHAVGSVRLARQAVRDVREAVTGAHAPSVDAELAAAEAALAARPDVAVVDIEMPGQDGISAAAELRHSLPICRTLILTMYGRPGFRGHNP